MLTGGEKDTETIYINSSMDYKSFYNLSGK